MKNLLLSMLASVTFLEASAFAMEDDRGSIVPHFSKAEVDAQPESHIIPATGFCFMRLQPSDEFVGRGGKVLVTPGDWKDCDERVTFYTGKVTAEEASKPSWYSQDTVAIVPLYNCTRINVCGHYTSPHAQGTTAINAFFYATEGASYTITADYKGHLEVRKKVGGNVPNNQFEIEEVVFMENPEDYIDGKSLAQSLLMISPKVCLDGNYFTLGFPLNSRMSWREYKDSDKFYDFGKQTDLRRSHSYPNKGLRRIRSADDDLFGYLSVSRPFEDKHLYTILANVLLDSWSYDAEFFLTDKGDLYSLLPASLYFMLSYKNALYLDQQ